ncbi:hypothetical protein HDV00_003161 [Rhizophlyctis rosea]|nr:hypothetical protein HDV00_003161 [Rhizophlyctis rosea]
MHNEDYSAAQDDCLNALREAARGGYAEIVEMLLQCRVSGAATDHIGNPLRLPVLAAHKFLPHDRYRTQFEAFHRQRERARLFGQAWEVGSHNEEAQKLLLGVGANKYGSTEEAAKDMNRPV